MSQRLTKGKYRKIWQISLLGDFIHGILFLKLILRKDKFPVPLPWILLNISVNFDKLSLIEKNSRQSTTKIRENHEDDIVKHTDKLLQMIWQKYSITSQLLVIILES